MIANALDEQILTGTSDVEIFEDRSGTWHIRDSAAACRSSTSR